jgi:hypothetical protein
MDRRRNPTLPIYCSTRKYLQIDFTKSNGQFERCWILWDTLSNSSCRSAASFYGGNKICYIPFPGSLTITDAAGSDTVSLINSCDCKTHITSHQTVSVITAYFLAVAKYPEVQAKAQTEINAVVGPNRLPTFEDRDSLPYIEAICKELYRWLPIVPLGPHHLWGSFVTRPHRFLFFFFRAVPHCAVAGDVYEKYFIPKGTPVIANVWCAARIPV